MNYNEIAELAARIVIAALQSGQTGQLSAEDVANYYAVISKQVLKTYKELSSQLTQSESEMSE